DLDATLDAVRAAGERVLDETLIRVPASGAAACFVTDPDGQLIELVQSREGKPRAACRAAQRTRRRGRPPDASAPASSAMRRSHDPRRRARAAPRMTPPALPPPGPNSVSATRAVSRKGVARNAAPPARGRFKASDSCRVMILAMISPGKRGSDLHHGFAPCQGKSGCGA